MARRGRNEGDPLADATIVSGGGREVGVHKLSRGGDGSVEVGSLEFRRQQTITAAAMVLDIKDKRIVKRLKGFRQDWQAEAWSYYRTTPLVGFGSDFIANALSRIRLYVAWQPSASEWPSEIDLDDPPEEMDVAVYETARNILNRLDQGQGLMEMTRKAAYGLTLPGEVIVIGREEQDPRTGRMVERFDAYSTSEIDLSKADKGEISVRMAPTGGLGTSVEPETFKIDPETAWFFRVWRPDPEFGQLASTPMQRVLEQCEEQGLLRRYMRGTYRSRLNAGILEVPAEWGFGPEDNRDDNGQGFDRLSDDLVTALMTAIGDEGSAATVVPYVIHAPADTLGKMKLTTFDRPFDQRAMEMRRRLDEEIASGLDLPDQVLLGLGDVKFRNAEVITDEQFRLHLEPLAIVWVRSLTAGALLPFLIADDVDPEVARQFTIWYDAAAVTSDPDQSASSQYGYDRALLSGAAWRGANNYTDEDAPSDEELAARAEGLPWPIVKPQVPGQQQPPTPFVGPAQPPEEPEDPIDRVPEPEARVRPAAALRAAGGRRERPAVANLGRRLASAESACRLKVQMAADMAMRRAFERMGASVRTKAGASRDLLRGLDNAAVVHRLGIEAVVRLGVNPQQHLDLELARLRDRFVELVQAHQYRVVALVAAAAGRPLERMTERSAASWARSVDHAWSELSGRLVKLAGDELFLSLVAAGPRDRASFGPLESERLTRGEFDLTMSVPSGLIRDVLSIAGGQTIPNEADPGTLGGVAGGPIVDDLLTEGGLAVAEYEWLYGDSSTRTRPFEPHERLDGVTFATFTDPVLANEMEFPPGPFYFPGDHAYCQCEISPRIVEREPAVVDPVSPSELRRRGFAEAPIAEAEVAKSRVPGYPYPTGDYPVGLVPEPAPYVPRSGVLPATETNVQSTLAIDLPRVSADPWQTTYDWKDEVERFVEAKFSGPSIDDVSAAHADAISNYQGSGYRAFNGALRGDADDWTMVSEYRGSTIGEQIRLLDEVVESHVLQEDVLLYRGVDDFHGFQRVLDQLVEPGDAFKDLGYVSVSASQDVSLGFDGLAMFEIELPAGARALPMPRLTWEGEILLPRGATFEFVSKDVINGQLTYRVRFIGIDKI